MDDGDPLARIALEAPVLIEITARREGIALQLCEDFIRCFPFIGGTQEANLAGLIDYEEVFERVAFLLATVALLLFLRVFRTVDWPLSPIMPKRGSVAPSFDCVVVSNAANSSAVRAGSRFWCANA